MKSLLEFLARRGFVVVTHGGKEHEAWAYEGPLDFEVAAPVRFGLGNTPIDALKALDWQLEQMAKATPAPMAAPLPPTCPASSAKRHRPDHLQVDARELATILAALRFHQDENLQGRSEIADLTIKDIATDGETLQALSFQEIDALCQRLNAGTKVRRDISIPPPPVEKGGQPLYRVVFVIDLPAKGPDSAAQQAQDMMSDPDSWPPVLQVIDHRGRSITVDLAHHSPRPSVPATAEREPLDPEFR
jgi:hypothetical protein